MQAPIPRPVRTESTSPRIPIDQISSTGDQPRLDFDPADLDHLAQSLRAHGQLQPILVRRDDASPDRFIVVCGERRLRAAALAGLAALDCTIVDGHLDPDDVLTAQLVENALRRDLKPLEQAAAFRSILQRRPLTHRQLADLLCISHQTITRSLALLDLPRPVQLQLERGHLSVSAAYEISKLDDPAEQVALAESTQADRLARSDVAALVRRQAASSPKPRPNCRSSGPGANPRPASTRSYPITGGRVVVHLDSPHAEPYDFTYALEEALDAASAAEDDQED